MRIQDMRREHEANTLGEFELSYLSGMVMA
jgi:hypothetical protein